jgi:hypothetical protein
MGHYNYPDPGKLPSIPENVRTYIELRSPIKEHGREAWLRSMVKERG